MHRSGTSAVTRLVNMMGAYFGPEGISTGANQENPKGFWERRDVRRINNQLLAAAGGDWDRVSEFSPDTFSGSGFQSSYSDISAVIEELDQHGPWVIKEPRLCLTWPVWARFLQSPLAVFVYRSPLQIARSLEKRNGIPLHAAVGLWESYMRSALEWMRKIPVVPVRYETLVHDPVDTTIKLLESLSAYGVANLQMPDRENIEEFVDPDLHRNRDDESRFKEVANASQIEINDSILRYVSGQDNAVPEFPGHMSLGASQALRFYEQANEREDRLKNEVTAEKKRNEETLERYRRIEDELNRSQEELNKSQEELNKNRASERKLAEDRRHLLNKSEELTAHRDRLKAEVHRRGERIRRLNDSLDSIRQMNRELMVSRRWQVGNRLIRIVELSIGRAAPELVPERIEFEITRALVRHEPVAVQASSVPDLSEFTVIGLGDSDLTGADDFQRPLGACINTGCQLVLVQAGETGADPVDPRQLARGLAENSVWIGGLKPEAMLHQAILLADQPKVLILRDFTTVSRVLLDPEKVQALHLSTGIHVVGGDESGAMAVVGPTADVKAMISRLVPKTSFEDLVRHSELRQSDAGQEGVYA